MYEALDANFRMVRKDVSSDQKDPSLNDGSAFFSRDSEFKRYLIKFSGLAPTEVRIHGYLVAEVIFTAFTEEHMCQPQSS